MVRMLLPKVMIQLTQSLGAWNTLEFNDVLQQEIVRLDRDLLLLHQGLTIGSYVTDHPIQAMILDSRDDTNLIHVKAGIFYTGIIAGCSCADDPTPIAEQNEYCVLQFCIDKQTAETTVTLVSE